MTLLRLVSLSEEGSLSLQLFASVKEVPVINLDERLQGHAMRAGV